MENDLENAKSALEEELVQALTGSKLIQEQLIVMKEELSSRQSLEHAEREKMQELISRLEANGIAVAQKQQEVEERESIAID